jgi:hypothetical protein
MKALMCYRAREVPTEEVMSGAVDEEDEGEDRCDGLNSSVHSYNIHRLTSISQNEGNREEGYQKRER